MSKSKTRTKVRKASADDKSDRKTRQEKLNRELAAKCGRLLGERVTSMQYPGGRSRRSFRVILKNRGPVIVSFRPKHNRAETERAVLKELAPRGALIPRLLASDGKKMLIQEEITGERLSEAMHGQDESRVEQVLDAALTSLADTHRVGSESGFDTSLVTLGETFEWLVGLLDRPAVIGNFLKVPAPQPNLKELESLLAVRKPRFIKWDSRPGNAMVREDDKVYWFDWEHCGARDALDDLAWMLCDEYMPDHPQLEAALLKRFLPLFALCSKRSPRDALTYLSRFGTLHSCVRLNLVLKHKGNGDWWNPEFCARTDRVGVTARTALGFSQRRPLRTNSSTR